MKVGINYEVYISKFLVGNLVPRLLRSGMRTLKFYKRREPGIYSHVSSVKGWRGGRETLIARGRTEDSEQEKSDGSRQLTICI